MHVCWGEGAQGRFSLSLSLSLIKQASKQARVEGRRSLASVAAGAAVVGGRDCCLSGRESDNRRTSERRKERKRVSKSGFVSITGDDDALHASDQAIERERERKKS